MKFLDDTDHTNGPYTTLAGRGTTTDTYRPSRGGTASQMIWLSCLMVVFFLIGGGVVTSVTYVFSPMVSPVIRIIPTRHADFAVISTTTQPQPSRLSCKRRTS